MNTVKVLLKNKVKYAVNMAIIVMLFTGEKSDCTINPVTRRPIESGGDGDKHEIPMPEKHVNKTPTLD